MIEKRDLKSCLFYYVLYLLNYIFILVKLIMKYIVFIEVFFFCYFNKKRIKIKLCLYIYDLIFSDGLVNSFKFSLVFY